MFVKWKWNKEIKSNRIKSNQSYGFGASLINRVKTLYSHTESCFLNNGWASNFFEIQIGVRQGCSLSPYLFILSAEVLATAIRKNIPL